MTEKICPDCGLIMRNEAEYVIKHNLHRNRYYCIRCNENRIAKSVKLFLQKQR